MTLHYVLKHDFPLRIFTTDVYTAGLLYTADNVEIAITYGIAEKRKSERVKRVM
jgi:hypothetical protein